MPQLRCSRHFRWNCEEEFSSLGIKGDDQSYFLNISFGAKVDGVYHEGLLDSQDSELFDALLLSLETEISKKELEIRLPGSTPQFFSWLQKHAAVMKASVTAEAKQKAGLDPNENVTTNPSESVNHVLKEAAEYEREMTLAEFIALAKAVAEGQRQEQLRAVVRKGKYHFKSEFAFFEVEESKWMREMTEKQRQHHLTVVMQTELDVARAPNQKSPALTTLPPYSSANLPNIPGTVLASIWIKASELLQAPNAVMQAPSDKESDLRFSVHSRSSSCPNSVTLSKNGQMSCTCLMFRSSPNVCSHAVTTAQKANSLTNNLEWVRQTNKAASVYDISTANVNRRAAGAKGGGGARKAKEDTSRSGIIDKSSDG